MATTWSMSNDDEPVLDDAVSAVRAIELTAKVLRVVAIVAGVVWLLGVVAAAWTSWDTSVFVTQSNRVGSTASEGSFERLRYTMAAVASATWGYAIVAVVALAGWVFAESRRAVVYLDALDDIDDEAIAVRDDEADADA
jgi:hypothetical protein